MTTRMDAIPRPIRKNKLSPRLHNDDSDVEKARDLNTVRFQNEFNHGSIGSEIQLYYTLSGQTQLPLRYNNVNTFAEMMIVTLSSISIYFFIYLFSLLYTHNCLS